MKSRFFLLPVLLILPSHLALSRDALPYTAISVPDPSASTIWDLSQITGEDPGCATYKQFGDTLLSETIHGNRRWYRMSSDSTFFVREESRSYYVLPLHEILTEVFNPAKLGGESVYESVGERYNMFPINRKGSYRDVGQKDGTIVTVSGDTIVARMTSEYECYWEKTSPHPDSLVEATVADSLMHRKIEIHRWFISGRQIPVAVQYDIAEEKPGLRPSNFTDRKSTRLNSSHWS